MKTMQHGLRRSLLALLALGALAGAAGSAHAQAVRLRLAHSGAEAETQHHHLAGLSLVRPVGNAGLLQKLKCPTSGTDKHFAGANDALIVLTSERELPGAIFVLVEVVYLNRGLHLDTLFDQPRDQLLGNGTVINIGALLDISCCDRLLGPTLDNQRRPFSDLLRVPAELHARK